MSYNPSIQLRPFLWVAFPSMLGGYAKIIDLAKSLGFGGIAPRAGQGNADGSFSPSLDMKDVSRIVDAGLECHPWWYSRAQALEKEIDCGKRCYDAGATSTIIDAESPWDAHPQAKYFAALYGDRFRKVCGDSAIVFDAPWPWIDYHPTYPEKEFRWVDGRLIQAYWTEIGVSARTCLDRSAAMWKGKDDRVMPIGVTYGRREISKWGWQQLPPGEIDAATCVAVSPEVTGGWYSAEAAGPGVLDALAGVLRASSDRDTLPGGHDDAFVCTPESVEECARFYMDRTQRFAEYALSVFP